MSNREQQLDSLRRLVLTAAEELKALKRENAKLRLSAKQFQEENGRLEMDLRRFRAVAERQPRLRARLEKLADKLDKVLSLAQ